MTGHASAGGIMADVSSASAALGSYLGRGARRKAEADCPLASALQYFKQVEAGTPCRGNYVLENHLEIVERVAFTRGLPPEGIAAMLDLALSLRIANNTFGLRVLKCLIPASVVPDNAVTRGVSWFCVGKLSSTMQTMFIRWLITVFDLIEPKEQLHALYGIFFSFLPDENLCPYICHLLYLLTQRENVKPFRIRRLMDLQSKMGKQPFLLALLSLYKVFCPEMVSLSMPSRIKNGFKNYNSTWKTALSVVQRNNKAEILNDLQITVNERHPTSRKRKWNTHLVVPPVSSCVPQTSAAGCVTGSNSFPLEQLATFPQLLQNIHCIELPAQMGSVLNSPLVLHYVNCVTDDSVFLRLDYWLGHALHEEFLFCKDTNYQNHSEATEFFNTLITAQQFLQEGFSSTEVFIYKFLRVWDGSLFRSQILTLLSSIPMIPCSDMKHLLFEPLMQLFFTSSLFFKCSVVECLNNMLVKWLTWHSVYATEDQIDLSVSGHSPMNMSLSGLMSSVVELVQFVGRLSTVALHLEAYNTLLLHFILDFYETVCDMYLKYDLPLVVMPPAGVFYPALLSKEPVSLNQLCHIMYRYRANLVAAKHPDVQTTAFHISRRTYREYNQYVVAMVSCLWKSNAFLSGMGIEVSQDLLAQTELSECRTSFNIVHHPALMGCAIDFFHKCWPESKRLNLNSIKGRHWDWYLEYLFTQGFEGLKEFIESSITRVSHSAGNNASR
ncbi:centromere protein I [Amia ocellicauda]|uniref:centromere protein I n=1 Tax=Amia ocellicauda TaxID=2972642 RepID=UPI0034642326